MVTLVKALTRRHNPDCLEPFPECTLLATEAAAFVSVNNDIRNRYALHTALHHGLRDQRVNPEITRGCVAGEWTGNGRFGRPMRQRLQSSAVIKFQTRICHKARRAGADAVFINPRNTSTLSCVCRRRLGGKNYAYPACAGRVIRVDGAVNAVLNARRTTTSVARCGRAVRPSRDEAQRTSDVIPRPGVLTRGGRIFGVDDRKAIPEHSRCPPKLTGATMPTQVNRTLITRPLQRYA